MENYINKVIQGDCLIKLKELEDNSVDSIVTDPPYELGFMGKSWDSTGIANNVEMWKECLRVLKPGGHLLAFSGTRTYHRMASAIEDAGFEIRDMIEWVYGSGFPKSLNIGKAVDKLQGNEREIVGSKKGQGSIPNDRGNWGLKPNEDVIVDKGTSEWEGWGTSLKPSHEPVVFCSKPLTPRLYFAILIGDISNNIIQLCQISNVKNAEKISLDFQAKLEKEGVLFVAENVRMNAWESLENVRFAEQSSISSEQKSSDLIKTKESSVQLNAKQSGNEDKMQEIKTLAGVEEDIKALMDIIIFGTTEDTSQNIASLWNNISEELLNQANTLTIKMATRLITDLKILKLSATQSILESTGSLFKTQQNIPPNHEPICMARKPLAEKTVAENCLKWGTGGINIDESRVKTSDNLNGGAYSGGERSDGDWKDNSGFKNNKLEAFEQPLGRFPANLIHDNSEEVRECFPDVHGAGNKNKSNITAGKSMFGIGDKGARNPKIDGDDGGNASRFFKSIIYQAKASKSDRNSNGSVKNIHPTCKPTLLMSYLIKMVTPKGGIVLDPFAGSGSTLVVAKQNGFGFIGIEMTEEYIPIIEARLNAVVEDKQQTLL